MGFTEERTLQSIHVYLICPVLRGCLDRMIIKVIHPNQISIREMKGNYKKIFNTSVFVP